MISIRELQQGDADHVLALDKKILGDDRSATWDQYVERLLSVVALDSLEYAPWGCFVAVDDSREGEIVGFLMSERQTPSYGLPLGARIVAVAVAPDYRHHGIGSMLLDSLYSKAATDGISRVFSVLLKEDERDATFLERCGFRSAGFRVLEKEV